MNEERHITRSETTEENATPAEVDALRSQQRDETHEMGATPTFGALPGPMSRGGWTGALVGALIGALIMAPFALIPIGDFSGWIRLVWFVIIGAAAGGAYGLVNAAGSAAEGDYAVTHDDPHRR